MFIIRTFITHYFLAIVFISQVFINNSSLINYFLFLFHLPELLIHHIFIILITTLNLTIL